MICNHCSILFSFFFWLNVVMLFLWHCVLLASCMHEPEANTLACALSNVFMSCGNDIEKSRGLLTKGNGRNKFIKCRKK